MKIKQTIFLFNHKKLNRSLFVILVIVAPCDMCHYLAHSPVICDRLKLC